MGRKKRLFWLLFPYFLAVILLTLILAGWFSSRSMRQFYIEQTAADLKVRARLLSEQLIRYVMMQDEKAMDRAAKRAGRESRVRITVVLPNGTVIGDSHATPEKMNNHADRPEIQTAMNNDIGTSVRFSNTLNQNMMYVAVPLILHKDIVAILRTSMSISNIDANLKSIRNQMIAGGAVIALVAAAFSLLIARRISRPVEEIKNGAERYARGEFDHKLPMTHVEELSSLALSMNQMAASLDERIRTIVRQRNEIEAVLSSMEEGVLAIDNEERIIITNESVARIFNYNRERMPGRRLHQIVRSAELQRFVDDVRQSGESRDGLVTLYLDRTLTVRVHSTPLKDGNNKQIGTLFVLVDVTKIISLENMRRDLAINVSHEIRTPLTAIKGFVDTLTDEAQTHNAADTDRFLVIIAKHVDRLVAIVDNLQSLSRIEEKDRKDEIRLEKIELCPVIQNAVENCMEAADKKNIRMETRCDADLVAMANATLLERAIVNLVENAIAYSQSGQVVMITARQDNSRIVIGIRDQGVGIARKHQDRIFERFYRADSARTRDAGGTGLGLAITKHIVLAHGGQIDVESALGKGSRFHIYLPVAGP